MKKLILTLLVVISFSLSAGCSGTSQNILVVFCAGSLIQPFQEIADAFEVANPGVEVRIEFHGSIQVIRHVTELHEPIDVVATADQALIPLLMYQTQNPDTGLPYANWNIAFAGNEIALAFSENSRFSDEINSENWMEILAHPDVRIGFADPRFDPAGYRSLMVAELAALEFGPSDYFNQLFGGQFDPEIIHSGTSSRQLINIPAILEPVDASRMVIRGSSIQLVALLQSGDLDYAFEYASVIQQNGLQMVSLPSEINLSSENLSNSYQRVVVHSEMRRFESVDPEFPGEPIRYGITIPSNSSNPDLAAEFIAFLLGSGGRQIMNANFHPMYSIGLVDHGDIIPEILVPLVESIPNGF